MRRITHIKGTFNVSISSGQSLRITAKLRADEHRSNYTPITDDQAKQEEFNHRHAQRRSMRQKNQLGYTHEGVRNSNNNNTFAIIREECNTDIGHKYTFKRVQTSFEQSRRDHELQKLS